ncbi:MAG: translation initiation factor IF-2 subunit gamma [Candidatus Hydrothermarchaeota archaeon]|nr:translation initiation factor IF-2 subunit gamma [Candidatus Hydrothermarchaeota archaeon]
MQAEVNIGMVGHVDHGKTTLTQALSGEWTDRHSEEIKRGISIRLGYASCTFRKCPKCKGEKVYTTEKKCRYCSSKTAVLREVSFVDAPGHETLMATMLSGAALMDGAVLVIAANEPCPQPQTKEHLMALDIIGVKNLIIVQNKIDLVPKEKAQEHFKQINKFVKGTVAEDAQIIPIAAQHNANIDVLIQEIEGVIPSIKRDPKKPTRMFIARSFDVNKPGTPPEKLRGGVVGGSLSQGILKDGQVIEIYPGVKTKEENQELWKPLTTDITSLRIGKKKVKEAYPGGLVGIGTKLDPSITKSDGLSGMLIGLPNTLPPALHAFTLKAHLLQRVVGTKEELKVEEIKTNEPLMLSIGTATTIGMVTSTKGDEVKVKLKLSVCADKGARAAISRRIGARWRLIGYGIIV